MTPCIPSTISLLASLKDFSFPYPSSIRRKIPSVDPSFEIRLPLKKGFSRILFCILLFSSFERTVSEINGLTSSPSSVPVMSSTERRLTAS
jgi:hypothetical protein